MAKKEKYKKKAYAHFDTRKNPDKVKHLVESPKWVAKHGFYPFIHYNMRFSRFDSKTKEVKPKERDIYYSSHVDRYIYEHYADKINNKYNERLKKDGTNKSAVAYRNNFYKKCNVDFAKEVFDFIKRNKESYIIIGDFSKFFDGLDHKYLKNKLCELLEENFLPDDYYKVFKSITKFSYVELEDLLKETNTKRKELNKKKKVLEIDCFRSIKHRSIKKNFKSYGVPQGAAISSVLANVYMLDFDKEINDYVTSNKGIYRRYSDDFVIVIPKEECENINKIWHKIEGIRKKVDNLKIQPKKTKVYEFKRGKIKNINSQLFENIENDKDIIDYLGFSFDGKEVTIRDKTITKYYYKMRQAIRKLNHVDIGDRKKAIYMLHRIYERFSERGLREFNRRRRRGQIKKEKVCGNFLSYVERADKIFERKEPIKRATRNHWYKIHKKINKRRLKIVLTKKSRMN